MLTVYRASAGAGKTHRLTGEYLALLFRPEPYMWRRILAVTFTNKATDEMKRRIVTELYRLARGKESVYAEQLSALHELVRSQLQDKALRLLVSILHDYSSFNISTIDRFFQQIMRAFTREIGLQGGYGIEMDQQLVLTEAVDRLLADLEKSENRDLLGWLIRFAQEKIEGGNDWNPRRDIMNLGREIFRESYKGFSREVAQDIADKQMLEQYRQEMYKIIRLTESRARQLAQQGLDLLARFSLHPADFKGGQSRSPLLFLEKLAGGEMKDPGAAFLSLPDNVENWYTKTADPALCRTIESAFNEGLNQCVKEIIGLFANLTDYRTARETVRYYYTLGILTDISRQITLWREEENTMLIADTTELLGKVIDGSDAPFIYEKAGTTVDHFMIDEFQDTSAMQWSNFRPLIRESLAHRHTNLIVGDAKQSIYRFRNSDWELLDRQLGVDIPAAQLTEEILKENWRSCKNIVEFNNAFFRVAPALLEGVYCQTLNDSSLSAEQRADFSAAITSAYRNAEQQVAAPFQFHSGHVRIEFLADDEGDGWKETALSRLQQTVERLQDNGYALKDIAILVRTNNEGALVADHLLACQEGPTAGEGYRYDVISEDALFVDRSAAVRLMVAALRYLQNPLDVTVGQMVRFSYFALCGGWKGANVPDFSPSVKEELTALSRRSLYEMAEGICRIFSDAFPHNEQIFVQAFLDMTMEYAKNHSADLPRFLDWWNETGRRKTVALPDTRNAIRILTIHKSKGLGFKAVIIPFADWEIDHKPNKPVVLWCHPDKQPFGRLHMVPVRYGKDLSGTIFAKDYFQEKVRAFIDNLNTLYVATTRAAEELVLLAPRPKKISAKGESERVTLVSELLWNGIIALQSDVQSQPLPLPEMDTTAGVFDMGEGWKPQPGTEKDAAWEEILPAKLCSFLPDNRLRLRLRGKELAFHDPLIKHGTLMHNLLGEIQTANDIPPALEHYCMQGVINRTEADRLQQKLSALLRLPEVQEWFDGSMRVLNETEILVGKGPHRRPDRVMLSGKKAVVVDYKFGEQNQSGRYQNQVKHYMRLIRQMGYVTVSGYLWYVEQGVIEPVITEDAV